MTVPSISVVLPAYNAASFIRPTLDSVLNQTYRDFELIVVDDGSTDQTAEVLRDYRDSIRYFRKDNGGQSSSRNVGIRLARGQYIAFIDHDDLWLENKLELQLKEMARGDDIGMVSCSSILFRDNSDLQTYALRINSLSRDKLIDRLLISNILGSCSAALVRAQCFTKVGVFDETLRMAEDWDMWLRIAKCYLIRAVETPLIRYRLHGRNFSAASGEVNLTNELVFLRRVFAEPCFNKRHLIKHRSFSNRYLRAAITLRENSQSKDIPNYLINAFLYYPPAILKKMFAGLLVYTLRDRLMHFAARFRSEHHKRGTMS